MGSRNITRMAKSTGRACVNVTKDIAKTITRKYERKSKTSLSFCRIDLWNRHKADMKKKPESIQMPPVHITKSFSVITRVEKTTELAYPKKYTGKNRIKMATGIVQANASITILFQSLVKNPYNTKAKEKMRKVSKCAPAMTKRSAISAKYFLFKNDAVFSRL